ncbi:hypothetical protein TNCV_1013381 [Trichonephila clavipes]|uniref:Uncharacterized protein n=1 Tax=Trichonephila clavipes TaxID=2585209 RepID=A0A8X7BAZ6_TRICX|nr:hypothetical protein TNCV_1013381 [Trichonephila clavipes]
MICDAEDRGFQMLYDDEIVTSIPEESDPATMKRMETRTTTTTELFLRGVDDTGPPSFRGTKMCKNKSQNVESPPKGPPKKFDTGPTQDYSYASALPP